MPSESAIELGQFDDAPEPGAPPPTDLRQAGHALIDDAELLQWSEDEDEAADADADEDELDERDFDDARVEDEDWEMAERDFTKQYNRLKQHVAVRTGHAQGTAAHATTRAGDARASVAALPAVNRPRNTAVTEQRDKTADQLAALSKYAARISRIDVPYHMGVAVNKKGASAQANMKDKSDRATSEQVLDPRTRIILFKMIGRGLIHEVNGCVSTGKEANVYHATSPTGAHLALKIYKTSILVFKDRDRYVSGEYRFRRGYNRRNPRKMVKLWAEKEMRNLKRLRAAGVPCPEPLEVRENVLVMSFLGDQDGWASPRLKDAADIIPADAWPALYAQLVLAVRTLFHACKLVHADLSEYNVLYHARALHVIDVSQSVEHDHPHAFDFLRADVRNVEDFFARREGVRGLGVRRCFEFVTSERVARPVGPEGKEETDEEALRRWLEEREADEGGELEEGERKDAANEDEVFMKSYIPRTLNEVYDPERDVAAVKRGEGKNLIYADTIGLVDHDVEAPPTKTKVHFDSDVSGDSDEDEDGEEGEEDGKDGEEDEDKSFEERQARGHRNEDKDAKKERKKTVKAEARERRKNKMPKAEKKRKVKATARSS